MLIYLFKHFLFIYLGLLSIIIVVVLLVVVCIVCLALKLFFLIVRIQIISIQKS